MNNVKTLKNFLKLIDKKENLYFTRNNEEQAVIFAHKPLLSKMKINVENETCALHVYRYSDFMEAVGVLNEKTDFTAEVKTQSLVLKQGSLKVEIQAKNLSGFPCEAGKSEYTTLSLSDVEFDFIMEKAINHIEQKLNYSEWLKKVLIQKAENGVNVFAMDGHQLVTNNKNFSNEGVYGLSFDIIKAMKAFNLKDIYCTESGKITVKDDIVSFMQGEPRENFTINLEAILNKAKQQVNGFKANRKALIEALDNFKTVEKKGFVGFERSEDKLKLSFRQTANQEKVNIKIETMLNVDFKENFARFYTSSVALKSFLKYTSTEEAEILCNNEERGMIAIHDDDALYVTMAAIVKWAE